ncbi:hypothetical protein BC826DRAFT_653183 [Russula brevipes]|nr:hypothetical protein BC826DRAFT_653183 [Russula brevipes]
MRIPPLTPRVQGTRDLAHMCRKGGTTVRTAWNLNELRCDREKRPGPDDRGGRGGGRDRLRGGVVCPSVCRPSSGVRRLFLSVRRPVCLSSCQTPLGQVRHSSFHQFNIPSLLSQDWGRGEPTELGRLVVTGVSDAWGWGKKHTHAHVPMRPIISVGHHRPAWENQSEKKNSKKKEKEKRGAKGKPRTSGTLLFLFLFLFRFVVGLKRFYLFNCTYVEARGGFWMDEGCQARFKAKELHHF